MAFHWLWQHPRDHLREVWATTCVQKWVFIKTDLFQFFDVRTTHVDVFTSMFTPCSRLLVQKDTLFKMQVKLYTLFMTQGSENHTLFDCTCPFSPNKWLPHSPTPHLRFSLTFLAQCPLFSLHGNLAITSEKLSCLIRALCNLEISFFQQLLQGPSRE